MPDEPAENPSFEMASIDASLQEQFNSVRESAGLGDSHWPVDTIYHYTNAVGLKGILETSELWATHSDYLNDASELTYGRQKIAERIREYWSESFKNRHKLRTGFNQWKVMASMSGTLNDRKTGKCFLVSFCNNPNLLSQWRAYGGTGGYCLGFKFDTGNFRFENLFSVELYNVLYDDQVQSSVVSQIRDMLMNELLKLTSGPDSKQLDYAEIGAFFREQTDYLASMISPRLKHPDFREENESRLSVRDFPKLVDQVQFRVARGLLIPYLPIPISQPHIKLESIYCGPTISYNLAKQSVDMLLKRNGWQDVEVLKSSTPLGW